MSDSDLLHHYKVLKQFLDISDDSSGRNKSTSSRAARAREKLLKLSSAQFCELSTDVFDELKRRIDESRSEPDFLLPRLTFHPKRNQARQKLSSLPQSRFKDLVSDISYEIERRNLHRPSSQLSKRTGSHNSQPLSVQELTHSVGGHLQKSRGSESFDRSTDSTYRKQSQLEEYPSSPLHSQSTLDANLANSTGLGDDMHVPEKKDVVLKQAIGIQPSTVVPAKANMTWSSDEESVHEDLNDEEEVPRRLSLSSTLNASRSLVAADNHDPSSTSTRGLENPPDRGDSMNEMASLINSHDQLKKDYEQSQNSHKSLTADLDTLLKKHNILSTEHADLLIKYDLIRAENDRLSSENSQIQGLKEELEELKSASASLRLENQSLRTEKRRLSSDFRELSSPNNIDIRKRSGLSPSHENTPRTVSNGDARNLSSQDMNAELQKLHEKLDQVPISNFLRSGSESRREEQLRNEVSQWQKKFESLRSDQILQSNLNKTIPKDLQKYLSPNGVLPLKTVARFFSLTESFFLALENSHPDSDLLFEKISTIAIAANKISLQGDHSAVGGNRHADTIRDAASHALTATRYFATHSNIMPKIIVERAVSEVAFSVCDIVSVLKLHDGSDSSDSESLRTKDRNNKEDDFSNMAKPLRITPKKPVDGDPSKVGRELQADQISTPIATGQKTDDLSLHPLDNDSPFTPSLKPAKVSGLIPQGDSGARSLGSRGSNAVPSLSHDANTAQKTAQPSILDKMKQFEKPSAQAANKDLAKLKEVTPESAVESVSKQAASEITEIASKDAAESAPVRSKSIFQSLRDRFTTDNTPKPAEEASELTLTDGGSKDVKPDETESTKETTQNGSATETPATVNNSAGKVEKKFIAEVKSDPMTEKSILTPAQPKIELRDVSEKKLQDNRPGNLGTTAGKPQEVLNSKIIDTSDRTVSDAKVRASEVISPALRDSKGVSSAHTAVSLDLRNPEKPSTKLETDEHEQVASHTASKNIKSPAENLKSIEKPEPLALKSSVPSTLPDNGSAKAKKVNYKEPEPELESEDLSEGEDDEEDGDDDNDDSYDDEEEDEIRQRQDYRKSMAAATFNFDLFDIDDPDNTLTQVLLYLEHQTVQVISTIQDLLSAIKKPDATRGELRDNSGAISEVIRQMTEATNTSMNQTRNHQLKEHGSWVVKSLDDCNHRMNALCKPNSEKDDSEFADRHFKQRLAGISFDIAKCTKELVKTVEEASLKEDIAHLDAKLNQVDDLT